MTAATINPPLGLMPVLQFCTPAQLNVDTGYQRATDGRPSRRLIEKMARQWDWRLYQPMVVSRRADGNLYVVDGQHRLEAARQRGDIPQLPCVITAYDAATDEAAAFVALNKERRPLAPINLYRAALAAGDPDAVLVDRLIDRAGLRVTGAADWRHWKPGWINNIVGIRQCHRQYGERVTRIALEVLGKAFPLAVLRYCGTLFLGIVDLVVHEQATLSSALLIDILGDRSQDEWIGEIRRIATERHIGITLAAKKAIAEAYAEAVAE